MHTNVIQTNKRCTHGTRTI